MYYEFYIDQFFAVHVLTGYLLLDLTASMLGISCSWKRLFAASLVNTAVVILTLVVGMSGLVQPIFWNKILFWAGSFIGLIGTEKLVFKGNDYRKSRILLATFLFAGIQQIFTQTVKIPNGIALGVTYVFLKSIIAKRKNQRLTEKVQVTLYWKGKNKILNGVMDTGNMLQEPLTGKAVSIVEKQGIQELLGTGWQQRRGFFLIPYHSIGTDKGWLQAVTMDMMEIRTHGRCVVTEHPILAIYEGNLSAQKGYQVILHPKHIN